MYLLSIFPFLQGANELHIVFILDILLLVLLIYKIKKNNKFVFSKDIKFIMILIWALSYLLTTIWSQDKELAMMGFLKFLTIPIFLIIVMQYDYTKDQKNQWFDAVAKIGAAMVFIILFVILVGKGEMFFFQNRLAGFFNYANSFALFLLIGIIITGFKEKIKWIDFIISGLLLIGILLTNSRAIMILTVFSYILVIIFNKKGRKQNSINLCIMLVVGVITVLIMKNFNISNRIATTSGESSEWVLRMLYYKDAIRLIINNLFGYGHMAWWYMQEGFQTGAYDAMYIHNGLLQIMVDAGVIPALLIIVTFIKGFFEKKTTALGRVLMLIILGHSMIDFNMEFLAITLVLFMTLEFENKVEDRNIKKVEIITCFFVIIYVFFALVTTLNKIGDYKTANNLFSYSVPLNTQLASAENKIEVAEKLYQKNKYFLSASSVLSKKEQSKNNYEKAYEYENWIVKNKRYTMINYIQYVSFLEKAINYYYSQNNIEKLKLNIERLIQVEDMINEVKESSDLLAYKIAHKPRLDMPNEMKSYIEQMKEFIKKYK